MDNIDAQFGIFSTRNMNSDETNATMQQHSVQLIKPSVELCQAIQMGSEEALHTMSNCDLIAEIFSMKS